MWVLLLNDMRAANIENIQPVCIAETKQELLNLLEAERVERYTTDNRWGKTYRQGGPLEWMNPPWDHEDHLHFQDVGTSEDWAESACRDYQERVLSLPMASEL
jgi:hypothetical protein